MVEVLAAIVILSVAILPMVGMFDAGLRAAVLGGNYDSARALANEKLEEIKASSYQGAVADYPPGGSAAQCPDQSEYEPFDCDIETDYVRLNPDGEIEPDPDARTMMQVTVIVTWDDGGPYTTSGLLTASSP